MKNGQSNPMDIAAFLRLYRLRNKGIMWFLGAGASRLAGIKTAGDMILDFKQEIYRSNKKLPPSALADTGNPIVRQKIQSYFDDLGTFPSDGAPEEYEKYFEATFPHPKDRRSYLDQLIRVGKPTFGHNALALLMREGLCRIVWTTNFDRTIEDATALLNNGTGFLTVADLGEPSKLNRAISDGQFPVCGKLHGDYHSNALKNTSGELRAEDEEMRQALINTCQSNGLAVVGYSGRDHSIMATLKKALNGGRGFPNGLFWFKRSEETPYETVTDLIKTAQKLGVDAHLIENEAFDELMSDIVRHLPETASKLDIIRTVHPPRLTGAPLRDRSSRFPVIRTYALPILSHPVMCRLVSCDIGGWQEIKEAIVNSGVNILAQRTKAGVIAFGRDVDIRKAFSSYSIKSMDTLSIQEVRLTHQTGELTLLRESLFLALKQRPKISIERRGRTFFALPDSKQVTAQDFRQENIRPFDSILGTVADTSIGWSEACALHVEYQIKQLWLLLSPRVFLDIPESATDEEIDLAREFVRERRARRYNNHANAILTGWVRLLIGEERSLAINSFGISDGLDASFEISQITGFSGFTR